MTWIAKVYLGLIYLCNSSSNATYFPHYLGFSLDLIPLDTHLFDSSFTNIILRQQRLFTYSIHIPQVLYDIASQGHWDVPARFLWHCVIARRVISDSFGVTTYRICTHYPSRFKLLKREITFMRNLFSTVRNKPRFDRIDDRTEQGLLSNLWNYVVSSEMYGK